MYFMNYIVYELHCNKSQLILSYKNAMLGNTPTKMFSNVVSLLMIYKIYVNAKVFSAHWNIPLPHLMSTGVQAKLFYAFGFLTRPKSILHYLVETFKSSLTCHDFINSSIRCLQLVMSLASTLCIVSD